MGGPYGVKMCGGTLGFACGSIRQTPLSSRSWLIRHWHPCNQKADALAWLSALETKPLVDTAKWVHRESGLHNAVVGWHIAKDVGLPLKYSDLVNVVIACHVCFKQHPRQLPKDPEAKYQSSQQVRGWQIDDMDPSLYVSVLNLPWFVWTLYIRLGTPDKIPNTIKVWKLKEAATALTLTWRLLRTPIPITPEKGAIYWNLQWVVEPDDLLHTLSEGNDSISSEILLFCCKMDLLK